MLIEKNSKFIIIGDSVTDCNRLKPEGEGKPNSLGNGYVDLIDAFLKSNYLDYNIRIINKGISGNTSRDLLNRWHEDIISLNPNWISIMIGINDVWQHFNRPFISEIHVSIEEYKNNLEKIVSKSLNELKLTKIILMTPFYLEPNKNDPLRIQMDKYGLVVKEISEKYNTEFVDLQNCFDEFLKYNYTTSFADDRVHVNTFGHSIIAQALLKQINFKFK